MAGISIVIPTLNEEESIGKVIEDLNCLKIDPEIVVVDDGSSDQTRQKALEKGARVIHREEEKDLGKSILLGIKEASNNKLIVLDGDGQHPVERVPEFAEHLSNNSLVIGYREKVIGHWPLPRRIMSKTASKLSKIFFRDCRKVKDPISGFFGIRKDSYNLEELEPQGYKILVEMAVMGDGDHTQIGYPFLQRENGSSSIGFSEIILFLKHLLDLKYRQIR